MIPTQRLDRTALAKGDYDRAGVKPGWVGYYVDPALQRSGREYVDADESQWAKLEATGGASLEKILELASSDRERARATLIAGALFFACRSCEYTNVPDKERKTRPIRACDIEFRTGARVTPHCDPAIFDAESVVIRFGKQKSGTYDDEIIMDRNTHPTLNTVHLWAETITRLVSYPGYDPQWPVYTFLNQDTKRFSKISNTEIQRDIKAAVRAIGRDSLGFGPDDVGTHSVRASLAMQLYLQDVPPHTIMLIGRWRSDAFLTYIEQQCREFTKGLSETMLSLHSFYQLPIQRQQRSDAAHHRTDPCNAPRVHFGRLKALHSRSRRS